MSERGTAQVIHRFSEDESEAEANAETPSRHFIGMLFKWRVAILAVLGVLLAAAIVLVVILPREFQSNFDVLVRNRLPPSARSSATADETLDEGRMTTEIGLLHSTAVADKVVDPEWPDNPEGTRTTADILRHKQEVAHFATQLTTTVPDGSNLIHATVTAGEPHHAAELATRLLEAFFAVQPESNRAAGATAFFVGEAARTQNESQAAQQALDTYRQAHPEKLSGPAEAINDQVDGLAAKIKENDDQIDAAIGRILTSERKLVTIPARQRDSSNKSRSDAESAPLLSPAQLTTMLAIYNDQQAILLTRPPAEETVRASLNLARQIASTTEALHLAQKAAPAEKDPGANPLWQQVNEEITQSSSDLHGLYAARDQLSAQLVGLRTTLASVEHPPAALAALQTKAQQLQIASRLATQRASEARIADAMDQQLRLNIVVASRPSFSNTPTSPTPWLYAIAIALTALFLAACLTFLSGMNAENYDKADEEEREYDERRRASSDEIPAYTSRYRPGPSAASLYEDQAAAEGVPAAARTQSGAHAVAETAEQEWLRSTWETGDPKASAEASAPVEGMFEEQDPEVVEEPAAQIFRPRAHHPASAEGEPSPAFEAPQPQARQTSSAVHAVVPSFFAAPPQSTTPFDHEPEEDQFDLFAEEELPRAPVKMAEGAAAPVVWEEPVPEPAPVEPLPMEAVWAAGEAPAEPVDRTHFKTMGEADALPELVPDAVPPWEAVRRVAQAEVEARAAAAAALPVTAPVAAKPLAAKPFAAKPLAAEPVVAAPAVAAAAPSAAVAPVSPRPRVQSFTSTLRTDRFQTSQTSAFAVPAFSFPAAAPGTPAPVAAPPVAAAAPVEARGEMARPPMAPREEVQEAAAEPVLPLNYLRAKAPVPETPVQSLPASSSPISTPVQDAEMAGPPLRYKPSVSRSAPVAPAPSPVVNKAEPVEEVAQPAIAASVEDVAGPPIRYRTSTARIAAAAGVGEVKPDGLPLAAPAGRPAWLSEALAVPASAVEAPAIQAQEQSAPVRPTPRASALTYEEMLKALVLPQEIAPYIATSDAAPEQRPRASEYVPENPVILPPWAPTAAMTAAASAPIPSAPRGAQHAPPAPVAPTYAERDYFEKDVVADEFYSVPKSSDSGSVPAAALPYASPSRGDSAFLRTEPAPPELRREDPQLRAADRISQLRQSGIRLTPSQRMKLGRPIPNYDKDGKVTHFTYPDANDKTRF